MSQVDTLFLLSVGRHNLYHVEDILAGLRWGCRGTYKVYVTAGDPTDLYGDNIRHGDEVVVAGTRSGPADVSDGFRAMESLSRAIADDVKFRRVVFLSNQCLVTGAGFDLFLGEQLTRSGAWLLGVRSPRDMTCAYAAALPFLYEWGVPHDAWESPPHVVCDDVLFLSPEFVQCLVSRSLDFPSQAERWPTTHAAYLSWVCQMFGGAQLVWGSADKALPPLYVGQRALGPQPPPQILSNQFSLYAPIDNALSYAGSDLREIYKKMRGEPAREVTGFGPVLSPGPRPRV